MVSQPKVVAVKVPIHEWQLNKHQWEARQLERRQEWNNRHALRESSDEDEEEETAATFQEAQAPNFEAEGGGPPSCQVVVQVTFFKQEDVAVTDSAAIWVHVYDYTPNMTPIELMMQRVQASKAAAKSSLLEEEESSPVPPPTAASSPLPANALKLGSGSFGTLSLAIPMTTSGTTRPTICTTQLMDCVDDSSASPQGGGQPSSAMGTDGGPAPESSAADNGNDVSPQMNFGAAMGERLTRYCSQRRAASSAPSLPQVAVYGSCGVSEEVARHFLGDGGMGTLSSASVVVFGKEVYRAARAVIDKEFE